MRKLRQTLWVAILFAAVGCGEDSGSMMMPDPGTDPTGGGTDPTGGGTTPGTNPGPQMVSVSGNVVDFETLTALGSAQVTASGVTPVPQVTMTGGNFLLTQVEPFSVFYLTAASPPDYLYTNQAALKVDSSDLTNVQAAAVKVSYLTSLQTAFKAQTVGGNGTLLVQIVDGAGKAEANVPAGAVTLVGAAGAKGPFFLDATMKAAPLLTATSASGWAVWFDVPAGSVSFAGTTYKVDGPAAPMAAGVATLARVSAVTAAMAPPPPKNVSFANQVVEIFAKRGCVNCHSGNGPGRDLGSLTLDASTVQDYKNVAINISPTYKTTRVNVATPAKSLLLTMPSYETPADPHPTVVFPTSADPDYQIILTWITEGAKNN
jgi:hypothetical protein